MEATDILTEETTELTTYAVTVIDTETIENAVNAVENKNFIAKYIDKENAAYLTLRSFGCDLTAPITNEVDFGILAMQFVFSVGIVFFTIKMLIKLMASFLKGDIN